MKNKRLFSMLLVICMIFSVLSPAAHAVTAGADSAPVTQLTQSAGNPAVSTSETELEKPKTLKTDPLESETPDHGVWSAVPVEKDPSTSRVLDEVPAYIQELRQAAEEFDPSESVVAFVVMEDAALAESHSSINQVSTSAEQQMLRKQDAVIASIEQTVLHGDALDVRYQFTYLTNAFSIETEFQNLEKIAAMDGVKSVFLAPVYQPLETQKGTFNPLATSSGEMVGVPSVWGEALGYTGTGMKIAVIDTGLDLDHKSFAAAPEASDRAMTTQDIDDVLQRLNAYKRLGGNVTAEQLYYSAKIPFAFNYSDSNLNADHSRDQQGDHGSHVAGIAAANANVEGTDVVGMAPDAQVIVMKVFGATRAGASDDIVAALEDAMTLGCDVANLSLGSTAGFSSTNSELDLIYQRIASQDIVVAIAAGNDRTSSEQNLWGTNKNLTEHPDNATINSPSIYVNATSVASANNAKSMSAFFTYGETMVAYTESRGLNVSFDSLAIRGELEYVMVPGLGEAADFEGLDVAGKIAVVQRGAINFSLKLANAEAAGAIGLIVYDNTDSGELFAMDMTDGTTGALPEGVSGNVPAVTISKAAGEAMAAAENKKLTVSAEQSIVPSANGGQMSSFSSWGVAPNLTLAPDITGIGGSVYSTVDQGRYDVMNGTSMATPQIAGIAALVMEYLNEIYPNVPNGTIRSLAEALLMSTAEPVVSSTTNLEASPRQQGSGLVNALSAVTAEAYLTVGGNKPKVSMGDNADGVYTFSFEVHNFSDAEKRYTLDFSLLTEDVETISGIDFMAEQERALSGTVTFSQDAVTVPAGGVANVTATVTLSAEDKAWMEAHFENGIYVEGYVYLENAEEDDIDLSLPFLGFYGDWTDAPVFDSGFWYDNSFFGHPTADGLPDANEYYTVLWTSLGSSDWVLGVNPYTGALLGEDGKVIYDPAHNSLSPNGDGILDSIEEMYISLMRNAKTLTFTYTIDGKVVHSETVTNASKTSFRSAYGQIVPWIYSWYGTAGIYDFAGLPSGTEVLLTIRGAVDYDDGGDHVLQIPITVDTNAPEVVRVKEQPGEDGSHCLTIVASDEVDLALAQLMNVNGTRVLGEAISFETDENGNKVMTFDITGKGTEFQLVLCDYAANESYFELTYSAEDDNVAELDKNLLYAYRIHDAGIGQNDMYGWVQFAKTADEDGYTWVEEITNDRLETYALTAAEYVGGMIFAVDAGYNLVVIQPGLWDRKVITNLGVSVLDMAFDDTTDTMYMVTRASATMVELQKLDLQTGELTMLRNYGVQSRGLYNIAVGDDGTVYATRYQSANLYTINMNDRYYTMTPVKDENGSNIVFKDYTGANVSPNYSQSMTFADGKLYWAYFRGSSSGNVSELLTIDPSNHYAYTHTAFANHTAAGQPYQSDNELIGLLTLDETEYQIPDAAEATSIWLDTTELLLNVGETAKVKVNPIPWNVELTDVSWTSSEETVATVTDGVITAVGEGSATITARHGELTATCEITVVNVSGSFYAYNYFSAAVPYGNMIQVDMATMNYETVGIAPVDFIAGDYNGHDGYFYGYTEDGQFYRYDMKNSTYEAIGAKQRIYPQDMAYDYTTGTMYAIQGGLYTVNLRTGEMVLEGTGYGPIWYTLACDAEGQLWSISTTGELAKLQLGEYRNPYTGQMTYGLTYEIVMTGLGYLSYVQSMCYDYANDVLIWATPEYSTVAWIDHNAAKPYILDIGNPFGAGAFELMGMYTIPENIPELPEVAVSSVNMYVTEKSMVAGAEFTPSVTILPTNANDYTITWSSSDTNVVSVKDGGVLKAVNPGKADATCTVYDNVSGKSWEVSVTITVIESADNLYGFIINSCYWVELFPSDPAYPEIKAGTTDVMYTQEYYDGKVYAYGYDPNEWGESLWNFYVMDPKTFVVEKELDMPAGFPFVYDMSYDYTTSTMFALAGPTEAESDLYMVDMETGALTRVMEIEEMLISLAAGPEGKLYAMENNSSYLYVIDPAAGTYEFFSNVGISSMGISSMTYDYGTDKIYWSASSGLAVIDPVTGTAFALGPVTGGSPQALTVSGLFITGEDFPEEPETPVLKNLYLSPEKLTLNVGASETLAAVTLPMPLSDSVTWASSNTRVATVDENGTVTAVGQGKATITATATDGTNAISRSCEVSALKADAGFLTYNVTDMGWSSISRNDVTQVTNLTEGQDETIPTAIMSIDKDVYGFDEENNFFHLDTETYKRTMIADAEAVMTNVTLLPEQGLTHFVVRDIAYDVANDRVLALGVRYGYNDYGQVQEFTNGAAIYTVDLKTGVLELLYTFNQHNYVNAMTVGDDGVIYFYNTFNQYYSALDLEAGIITDMIAGSTQSAYGDDDGRHDLFYDSFTGLIYHLFTSNSTFYRMYTVNPETCELVEVGYVGEMTQQGSYRYTDNYSGLTFVYVHEHFYEITQSKEPTCTEDGYNVWVCLDCGETYTEVVEALGHDLTSTVVAPDCTAEGYTEHTCGRCQWVYRDTFEPALGHSYTEVVTNATCTTGGYTTYTCDRCQHSYIDDLTDALGHNWSDWTVTREATCEMAGEKERTCSACGCKETEVILPIGHDYVSVVVEPTCETAGYTKHTCTCCNKVYMTDLVEALGHSFGQWTQTKAPTCVDKGEEKRECDRCDAVETRETDPLGHSYEIQVVEPTCVSDGYTRHTCTACGDSYYTDPVAALGHKYESVVTAPTCTENGYTTHTCAVCGDSYVDSYVDALGHSFGEWETVKEATCTEKGEEIRTCEVCGETETREIPAFCPAENFTDVDTAKWYHEGICYVIRKGLMEGQDVGIFAPEANLSRAELVTVLYRMAGEPSVEGKTHPFEDVSADAWYAEAVTWAFNEEVVKGMSATAFAPDWDISREQIATILFRYSGEQKVEGDYVKDYTDANKISDYALDAMNWAVSTGLIQGTTSTTLAPKETAIRAQFATILMRYCEK